jgi:hypothetical protein
VDLAHGALEALAEVSVVEAEPAVAVGALGMGGEVLLPEQLERHPLALELLVDVGEVGGGVAGHRRRGRGKQQGLERGVIDRRVKWPDDAGPTGPFQVLGHRPFWRACRRRQCVRD